MFANCKTSKTLPLLRNLHLVVSDNFKDFLDKKKKKEKYLLHYCWYDIWKYQCMQINNTLKIHSLPPKASSQILFTENFHTLSIMFWVLANPSTTYMVTEISTMMLHPLNYLNWISDNFYCQCSNHMRIQFQMFKLVGRIVRRSPIARQSEG